MSTAVFEPTRKLLEQTFATGWGSRSPVKYENVAFAQPANAKWVGFFVRWGDGSQVSLGPSGSRMDRESGAIIIQVFTPKNSGQKASMDECDFAGSIFRMQTLTDSVAGVEVVCRVPTLSDQGEQDELLQKTVSVLFQVDALF
jgi:hypothetical protein